ncbi:hypothetical protein TVAG_249960 [Trichomonas vaginalis G3]|uniref:Uncharacterized protein n=1 Tax=Trichomonas vaginalis (strain ATCC PRA-98 / G3) TaxID=412133 RepID=A2DCJ9_TRIV3|nr:hypothetical protein TVAGG3_0956410 [Trichomonas vaginalis G3]EAY21936.1 hypothetical protein TVAG_249960 [Trichomonas vaginalis G3]KAI5487589.1 hypothetical protein TVAGG3_0956410 [Trichomonas vaginalis G3]|eukprot:XP_001582922.1 hypothetical protein [Trichomonas vaginalis G3]
MFAFFWIRTLSGTDSVMHCDRNFSISGAGTIKRPFAALPLPGYTYKFAGEQKNYYTVFETRSILNFSNVVGEINYNLHLDRQPINITSEDIAFYNKLREEQAFFDFYVDGKKTSVQLFQSKPHSNQMFYQFAVNIYENPYKCYNYNFQVVPTKADLIDSMATRNISFFFNFLPLIPPIQSKQLSFDIKYLIIGISITIILIITMIVQTLMLRHNSSIPHKEIWRLSKNMNRTIISVILGLYIILWYVFACIGRNYKKSISDFFLQTFIITFIIPVFLGGILSLFIGVDISILHLYLTVIFGILVPFLLTTIFAGGNRGLPLFQNFVWFIVISFSCFLVCNNTFITSLVVRLKYTADTERGEIKEKQAPTPSWKYALDAGYIAAISYAAFPCIKYLVDASIVTQEINPIMIFACILSVCGVSGLFGIFTSSLYIRRHNLPWMGSVFGRGVAAAVFVSVICLLYSIPQVSGTSSYLYFTFGAYFAGLCVFAVGNFASFIASTVVLEIAFTQQKIV